jgi:HEAT repeat protein
VNAHDVGSANRLAMIEIVKLSYQPDGSSLTKLKEIAQRNGDTSVRIAAIRALAGHTELGALSFLANRLVADPEPDIRLAAAEAIAQANTSASRSVVARAAVFEKDPQVRKRLEALMNLRPGQNPQ